MRGVSEEYLRAKLKNEGNPPKCFRSLVELIEECKELNPWLPIDENTPKDRRILLKFNDLNVVGEWRQLNKTVGYFVHDRLKYEPPADKPTHYQELPSDPKE